MTQLTIDGAAAVSRTGSDAEGTATSGLTRSIHVLAGRAFADRRIRYVIVGGWNTVFGYAAFAGLTLSLHQRLHYVVILLIGHIVTVSQGFVLHRSVVYRVTGHLFRDFSRFQMMYAGALAANAALLVALVHSAHLPVLLAQALIVTALPLVTYFGHKHFTFRRSEHTLNSSRVDPTRAHTAGSPL
jgi:putative flippase GtrA